MDLPNASWVNLALQIPLALVIVVLVIYFLRFLEKFSSAFLQHMAEQRQAERENQKETIGRLAEEIKHMNTDSIRELTALVNKVDGVLDKTYLVDKIIQQERGGDD